MVKKSISNMHQPERASSVAEVLVVSCLSLLLVGLMAPILNQSKARRTLRSEARMVESFLDGLGTQAIAWQAAIEVQILAHSIQAKIVSGEQAGQPVDMHSPAQQITMSGSVNPIYFYPSSASPATITLSLGKANCTVTISLRGRVRTTC